MTTKYSFPAEWHAQEAILITWPHRDSAWAYMLDRVEKTYLELTAAVSSHQALIIQLHSSIDPETLSRKLSAHSVNLKNCYITVADSDDTWARDHGPIARSNQGKIELLDFCFNGWGNKFESSKDNALNQEMEKADIIRLVNKSDFILEGGSIESDGEGTLLTTAECLLNENRNSGLTRNDIESYLSDNFGIERFLWLGNGHLEGDDTDAHIDTLVRFANADTLVFQGCQNSEDSHFKELQAMKQELESFRTGKGQSYCLIELPLPAPVFDEDGNRLPATYANFLITDKQIIVPTYNDPADDKALKLITEAFPDHSITGINANPLIEEHGSIHCITMQLPKGSVDFTKALRLADLPSVIRQ